MKPINQTIRLPSWLKKNVANYAKPIEAFADKPCYLASCILSISYC
jgi:hypothetical protein